MKISSVRSFLLSCPLPEPAKLQYHGGERTIIKRDAMVIRIEADNGLIGYGPGAASEAIQQVITTQIAPFLEGRAAVEPDALRIQFFQRHLSESALLKVYCTVEVALYDLIGTALGLRVSGLRGGGVGARIRLIESAGMYMTREG